MTKSTEKSSCCAANGGVWKDGKCYATCSGTDGEGCSGTVSTTCADAE